MYSELKEELNENSSGEEDATSTESFLERKPGNANFETLASEVQDSKMSAERSLDNPGWEMDRDNPGSVLKQAKPSKFSNAVNIFKEKEVYISEEQDIFRARVTK